jgi:integrase|tara:strand:+ start:571 stop:1758 length:1188 start_codon:yes stop_codon:yes gene_type:complete
MLNIQAKYHKSKAKLGKSAWCVDTRSVLEGGTRNFYATKEEAIHALDELKKVISPEARNKDTWKWTFSELQKFYLERMEREFNLNERSKSDYEEKVRHTTQFLKTKVDGVCVLNMLVTDLTVGMVQYDIMDQLKIKENGQPSSKKRVENILTNTNAMMKFSKAKGCRDTNPIDGVERKGKEIKQNKKKAELIASEIIAAVEATMSPQWAFEMRFAYTTGLRQAEQRALTWGCLDLEKSRVKITRAVKHKDTRIGDPKTYAGERTIDLSRDVVQALKELYILKGRPNDPNALVFATKTGRFKTPSKYLDAIHRACVAADVPLIRWHDLRHYCASKLLKRYSNDLWRVRSYMGHSTIQVTQDTYGHWLVTDQEDTQAVDTMTDIFSDTANIQSLSLV